jgi:hypothetical protein
MALVSLRQPTDYYLDYTLKETLRQLEKHWRKAIADGRPLASDNPAGLNRLIGSLSTTELQKFPRTPGVQSSPFTRPDLPDAQRVQTLTRWLPICEDHRSSWNCWELIRKCKRSDAGTLASSRGCFTANARRHQAPRERVASLTGAAPPGCAKRRGPP